MRRLTGILLTVLGAVVLAGAMTATVLVLRSRDDEPHPTAVDLLGTADPRAVTDEVISFFEGRVQRDPVDYLSYTKLGEAYIRQGRETGDITAYQRAEVSFSRALEISRDDPIARAGLATALYSMHDFQKALSIAERVYAEDPSATQALALIGDANLALGNYPEAYRAYGQLSEEASGPSVLSRLAYLDELRGNRDRAIDVMAKAEEAAVKARRSPGTIAFYRLQLGALYFGGGRYDSAEQWYQAALDVFPGYYQTLAGLGNVEAARGHFDKAIDYYTRSVAAVPEPSVLAALGDAYMRTGDAKSAQEQYDTVEFIGELASINKAVYNRELVLYYADHDIETGKAVELAVAELDVRKDVFGYDAAAWALYRDGRTAEAAPLMEQALRLGTNDARMLFHAGMIASALGRKQEAGVYLERALDLNPHFSVLQEPVARQALAEIRASDSLAQAEE